MTKRKIGKKAQSTEKKNPQQRIPGQPKGYYFVVSGEIEYKEADGVTRYQKANMVHAELVAPGKPEGITVKGLAEIQTGLQMHFHAHYSKTHKEAPEITNVTILSVSHLGVFTKEEFYRNAPGLEAKEERAPEPTLPAAPAEQSLPEAPSAEAQTLPQESEAEAVAAATTAAAPAPSEAPAQ